MKCILKCGEKSTTMEDNVKMMGIFYKQTKSRNETGSNLSLGTRLTVLSKRLGRKRCCDATPDYCQKESISRCF